MRLNCGVNPTLLLDQHLVAEYRELLIPYGQMLHLKFKESKLKVSKFTLGTGHIIFWRDKQLFLQKRFYSLKEEMVNRGFEPKMQYWDLIECPKQYLNDWETEWWCTQLIRQRIWESFQKKPEWYRYKGEKVTEDYSKQVFFEHPVFM